MSTPGRRRQHAVFVQSKETETTSLRSPRFSVPSHLARSPNQRREKTEPSSRKRFALHQTAESVQSEKRIHTSIKSTTLGHRESHDAQHARNLHTTDKTDDHISRQLYAWVHNPTCTQADTDTRTHTPKVLEQKSRELAASLAWKASR